MSATLVHTENDRTITLTATVAGQTVFPFDFPVQLATDLRVEVALAAAPTAFTALDYGAGAFAVSGLGVEGGGSVTLAVGRAVGDKVAISGDTGITRAGSIVAGGKFQSDAIDVDLDRSRMIEGEIRRDVDDLATRVMSTEQIAGFAATAVAARDAAEAARDIAEEYASAAAGSVDGTTYSSREIVQSVSVASAVKSITTRAYYASRRGGGGVYVRVSAEPAHSGKLRTADRYLADGSTSPSNGGWWELVTDVPEVEQFGGGVSQSPTVNAAALAAAAQYVGEGGVVTLLNGVYNIKGQVTIPPVMITGEGGTVLAFDNATPGADGLVFTSPSQYDTKFGLERATVRSVGGRGGRALVTPAASGLNALRPRPIFRDLAFRGAYTASPDDSFAQDYSWNWMFELGDAWNLILERIDACGSYVPENDPGAQDLDGFVRFNPTDGILSCRMTAITTHNIANACEVRRRTFVSMQSVDIARAWRGIYDAPDREFETLRYDYGEAHFDGVIINAQKAGVYLSNRYGTKFSGLIVHRTADAFDHGQDWFGVYLDDPVNCDLVAPSVVVPSSGFTGTQYGIVIGGGNSCSLVSPTFGGDLDHCIDLRGRASDGSAAQGTVIIDPKLYTSVSGEVLTLTEARSARVSGFAIQTSLTYGSLVSFGNTATQQSCFLHSGAADATHEWDNDLFWYRPGGASDTKRWRWAASDTGLNLATQGDDLSAGSNAMLLARSGKAVTNIELRASVGLYLNSPALQIPDGVTAPATASGRAQIYVDSADGDLKVKFGDGTVKTIVVDT